MLRTHLRRTGTAAVASLLLVAALAGCGNDTGDGSASAEDSSQSVTGRKVDTAEFVGKVMAGLESATTARLSVDVTRGGGDPLHADGQVDLTSDPVSFAMSAELPPMANGVDVRLVDGVAYANLGPLTNDKFVKYDLAHGRALPDELKGFMDELDSLAVVKRLGSVLTSVTDVGDEQIDGTATRHYVLVLDLTSIPAMQKAPDSAKLPDEVSVDVWLDSDSLIRQLRTELDVGTPVQLKATFFDWGKPVDIQAPPASDVAVGRHTFS